jgi:hypothetical protein
MTTRLPVPLTPPGTLAPDTAAPATGVFRPKARRRGFNWLATSCPAPIAAAIATKPRRENLPAATSSTNDSSSCCSETCCSETCCSKTCCWVADWCGDDEPELISVFMSDPLLVVCTSAGSGKAGFGSDGHEAEKNIWHSPPDLGTMLNDPLFEGVAS